jgi:hypothetical protein
MRPVALAASPRASLSGPAAATVAVTAAGIAAGVVGSVFGLRYALLGGAVVWGWTQLVGL